MPTTFACTLRSLRADGFHRCLWGFSILAILFALGIAWLLFARIDLYEVSHQARLEAGAEVHPVAALVAGRILSTALVLGREVKAGEVLAELESEGQQLRVEEGQARLQGLAARQEALAKEMTAEEEAWIEEERTYRIAREEARAREKEAEVSAAFAEDEANRGERLKQDGAVSISDYQRVLAEAQQRRAAASALTLTVQRLKAEETSKGKAHQVRMAKLHSDRAVMEEEMATSRASIKRLQFEIEKRRIRAPISGQIAQVANVRIGAYVEEGDKLGAILPADELKAVAPFPPDFALGKIRPGQPARLRLDGFPWAQYGTISAQVTRVANEPRDGQIRVEFTVDGSSNSLIPLQHGLPGTVEVRVERLTPLQLVLRTGGQLLTSSSRSAAQPDRPFFNEQ